MTKKHFIELADYFRKPGMLPAAVDHAIYLSDAGAILSEEQKAQLSSYILRAVAKELAGFCIDQNPRFNRQLWMDYIAGECGPNGGKVKSAER